MEATSGLEFACYEDLPLGTFVVTHQGELVFVNHILCELLKCSCGDLVGSRLSDIMEDSVSLFNDAVKAISSGTSVAEIEIIFSDTDRNKIPVRLSITGLKKHRNLLLAQAATITPDASSLQDSIMFEAVINSLPDATYFKNLNSEFIKVNSAYLKKFSVKNEGSLANKTDFDIFSVEHAQQAYDDEQRIVQTGKPLLNIEEKETYEDGTVTWVSTSKMPLYHKSGVIMGTFGISRDITEQKRAETEIRLKTSILHAITSRMPVVIYRVSPSYEVTTLFGSRALIDLFEDSKIVRLKIKEGLSHIISKLSQKDQEGYINFTTTNQDHEETVYFENYVFEREGESGEFLGLALDVTERKNSQFKLKRDAKKLEKINRELNEFAYIVSHDLKAPLRAIVNLADWIEEDLAGTLDDDVQKNLELMKGRVHRMENLINGILQYSRVTKGARINESVDVGDVLNETISALDVPDRFTIRKNGELPVITYSRMDLDRIFANLISNVVKYHHKETGVIDINCVEDGDYYVFSVADDGPGIDSVYHEKIFKIFQTLQSRDSKESTGIGLTIVKKIVEERGGTISVESESGKGTKFVFTIPKKIYSEQNATAES